MIKYGDVGVLLDLAFRRGALGECLARRAAVWAVFLAAMFVVGCEESRGPVETIAVAAAAPDNVKVAEPSEPQSGSVAPNQAAAAKAESLAASADQLDRTLWAAEVLAQRHEAVFIRLWDEMRESSDPFEVLAKFPLERMIVGRRLAADELEWTIRRTQYGPGKEQPAMEVDASAWRAWLKGFQGRGFRILQSEWHHSSFEPAQEGQPARSQVTMEIHLAHQTRPHTLLLKGSLGIEWAKESDSRREPAPSVIDATRVTLLERQGPPPFRAAMKVDPQPTRAGDAVEIAPLIVHDLDGDGLAEVVLGGCNTLLHNRGGFRFERRDLFDTPVTLRNSGVVGDFTGDGRNDLVGIDHTGKLVLGRGDAPPRFFAPPTECFSGKIDGPSAVTAGDIDGDGDLDLWLTQYKAPYIGGQMPTPFYDACDGFPSYLLLNDGSGKFHDATEPAGLAAKRNRRTYSASFMDLDDDGDLDLLVVSDFSGLDLHENDGRGRFQEVTSKYVADRHGFGMAHALGDFDRDGKLDLYFVGMSSTTARRLERMGLRRADRSQIDDRRMDMAYGNRLYQRRDGRFVQTKLNDSVARAGWAWGCSACDFDNDGDDELYVANGHMSGRSSKDYCTRYWCHDVYVGSSKPDPEVARFLTDAFRPADLRGLEEGAISWNGYEHKKLFLNLGGRDFVDIAPLVGVAYEFDARGVVTADLDADGRMDLLVVKNQWANPVRRVVARQSLYMLQNQFAGVRAEGSGPHRWLGVRLVSARAGVSPIGAQVVIRGPFGTRERRVVTGDSYYAQHPSVVHFGLAGEAAVDEIVVRWPNGQTSRAAKPPVNRYSVVEAPHPN